MENDYGRQLVSAAARHEALFADDDSEVRRAIMDYLYGADQKSVAVAVSVLRAGAEEMLGVHVRTLDIFGPAGDEAVGDGWDGNGVPPASGSGRRDLPPVRSPARPLVITEWR